MLIKSPDNSQSGDNENNTERTFEKRIEIVEELSRELSNNSSVFALCLEGADADEAVDEFSDIDMRVVIEEGREEEIISLIEASLSKNAPIDLKVKKDRPKSSTHQVLYHIEGTSKFLIIDVMVQTYSDSLEIKGSKKPIFDKKNILSAEEQNLTNLNERIQARVKDIESKALFREIYLERELERGNYLEAVKQYHFFILEKVVEALRLLYCPQKSDYYLKHISRDLPAEVVSEVEDLYRVNTVDEIKEKKQKADKLLFRTLEELKNKV